MFLLLHIGSVLILTMAGSLFLFISVVAFIASRQQWESILFLAWLCFESTVVFNALPRAEQGAPYFSGTGGVLLTPPQYLINFWPHPHGIVKVHLCVGTYELRER